MSTTDRLITQHQHDILRHALGLDESRRPCQNHYCHEATDPDCQALVKRNLMSMGHPFISGTVYYFVTDYGKRLALQAFENLPPAPIATETDEAN